MTRWMAQLALELRLLLKYRWPLLLPPAAGLYMAIRLLGGNVYDMADDNLLAFESHAVLMTVTLAVPVLLGVMLIRRDTLHPSYEWSLSLPVSNWTIIGTKWLAGFLYMSLFTLAISAAYAICALKHGIPLSSIAGVLTLTGFMYETYYGISLALGLLLGALMPARFSLPIAFCGWVFGAIFLQLFVAQSLHFYPVRAFFLNHFFHTSLWSNEVWSVPLAAEEYARLVPFAVVFGLFMLVWSWARISGTRSLLHPKRPRLLTLVAFAAAVAAFVPYAGLWHERYEMMATLGTGAPLWSMGETQPQSRYAFRASSYDLNVVRRADDAFGAVASIRFPVADGKPVPAAAGVREVKSHKPGYITFLLHPLLKVTRTELNGTPVEAVREGAYLHIPSASLRGRTGEQRLVVEYGGDMTVWAYGSSWDGYLSFIRGDNIYLPSYSGWYPLPGGDSLFYMLYDRILGARKDADLFFHSDFRATLTGFDGPLYASIPEAADSGHSGMKRFYEADSKGLSLFGGHFREVSVSGEPITVVTTPGSMRDAENLLQRIRSIREYYESWGRPLDSIERILYFPMESIDLTSFWPFEQKVGHTLLLPAHPQILSNSLLLYYTMELILFGDTNSYQIHASHPPDPESEFSLVTEIRSAILYMADRDNRIIPFQPIIETEYWHMMKSMIDRAIARGDEAKVWQVLASFWDRGLSISVYHDGPNGQYVQEYPIITADDWAEAWNRVMPGDADLLKLPK